MSSYHHHCHPVAVAGAGSGVDATAASGYCYCCYTDYYQCHYPPPPAPTAPPPPPPPHSHLRHLYSSQVKQSYTRHIPPHFSNHNSQFQEPYFQEEEETPKTISSLLRRVTALELSLRRRSPSSSSQSLRHAAARTIQTHYRAFLVRRSKTLRQLKTLASIKSALNTLKSSISANTCFDSEDLSQKATSLLLKLDSTQGEDPMIRDAKRSIHRELIKLFDFIDGLYGKRRKVSSRIVKNGFRGNNNKSRVLHSDGEMSNVDFGGVNVAKLRGLVEKIDKLSMKFDVDEGKLAENPSISTVKKHGISQNRRGCLVNQHGEFQTKPKKSVSFAENGKVNRVLRRIQESLMEESDGSIDGDDWVDEVREVDDYPHREVEDVGVTSKHAENDDDDDDDDDDVEDEEEEEDQLENGVTQFSSNGERGSRKILGQS